MRRLAFLATLCVASLSTVRIAEPVVLPLATEHRYRIVGKVRLLFFWVGADDVGAARITTRREGDAATIALLIGSNPEKAPRRVNEWGYIHEAVRGDSADVFGVRSTLDADSIDEAEAKLARGADPALFAAMCSTVTAHSADAYVTSVRVQRNVTYRHFSQLLDAVALSERWQQRRAARPADAEPGFLTALDSAIRESTRAARAGGRTRAARPVAYVYKGGVYDLELRRTHAVAPDLLRGEYTVRNRRTGDTTAFTVTAGIRGALENVPVAATYQPNWWFKIELQLDEDVEVPGDPTGDPLLWARITDICAHAPAVTRSTP